jgi:hypothetical protein
MNHIVSGVVNHGVSVIVMRESHRRIILRKMCIIRQMTENPNGGIDIKEDLEG